jgi:hypothetical protein
VEASTELQIELLSELRAALADQEEISSDVRENVAGLAVHTGIPGVDVWVFVGYSGRYFSWHNADRQHPVRDVAGAARRIAGEVASYGEYLAGEAGQAS